VIHWVFFDDLKSKKPRLYIEIDDGWLLAIITPSFSWSIMVQEEKFRVMWKSEPPRVGEIRDGSVNASSGAQLWVKGGSNAPLKFAIHALISAR